MSDRVARWIRLASLLAIGLALLSTLQLLPMERLALAMRASIDGLGLWGPVVYAALYVVATVLLLPGAVITLAAGALFGPWLGTLTVSLASVAGASAAFLIARYLARQRVEERLAAHPKFAAIDRAVGRDGWKIVGLLRLSPAIPFNVSNYLFGLTSIPFGHYVLTSWIAMAPGTFMYVYLGWVAAAGVGSAVRGGDGTASTEIAQWALRGVGLAATVAVTLIVARIARRAIDEQTDIARGEPEPATRPAQAPAPAPAPARAPATGWRWRTAALATAALLAVAAAGYARSHRAALERGTDRLLGESEARRPVAPW